MWNIKLQVPGYKIVNNLVKICRDTKDNKTFKIVNITSGTIWEEDFKSRKDALMKILNFKNKYLVGIEEIIPY